MPRLGHVFRHVAMFRWVPGTTGEQVDTLRRTLSELPAAIPELRAYHLGPDAGLVEGNWEFTVVADFDDTADWRTYTDHPAHQKAIAEVLRPMIAQRAAVQYTF